MKTSISLGALCAGLALGVSGNIAALAQESTNEQPYFTDLIVFGDSLSDPGNIPLLTGLDSPPAPYFQNQFSSGPVFSTLYDELLGFNASRALNFAVGGAQFGTTNIDPALNGTGISAQIAGYLATNPTIEETELFHVLGGANNYFAALAAISADPANAATLLTNSVDATIAIMAADTQSLLDAGAHQFVLPNLPNLGGTPLFTGIGQQELGFNFSLLHNNGVKAVAAGLNDQGAIAYVVDSYTVNADIQANPSKYGLTNTTAPCFVESPLSLCSNDDEYQFFDNVHPTGAVHAVFAAATADTLLAPRTISAQTETSLASSRAFLNRTRSALALAQANGEEGQVFVDLAFGGSERENQSYAVGYSAEELGLTIGYATSVDDVTLAFAGQITTGETELNNAVGSFDRSGLRAGVFLGLPAGPVETRMAATLGLDKLDDITRNTGLVNQTTVGENEIGTFAFQFEAALPLALADNMMVAPYTRLVHETASSGQYDETGVPGLDQRVFAYKASRNDAELGARALLDLGNIALSGDAAYVVALDDADTEISTALTTVLPVVRTLPGAQLPSEYLRFGGDVSFQISSGVRLSVGGFGVVDQDDGDELTGFVRLSRALGE